MAQAVGASASARRIVPRTAWRARLRIEVAGLTALLVAALLVRLPYLWLIPQFTDESANSLRSLSIANGQRFPLTEISDYIGALYYWLEAVGFLIFGVSPYTPRLWTCLLGALAVGVTYLLAREMIGSRGAWLTAGLLATSGVHIGGNSHVAWSHETTPLFLAITLLFLHRAVRRGSGSSLLGAGFAGGLTLQTHPTVLAFVPGAIVFLLWKGPALLRTRWPYLAACLFVLAYSNVIVYNATTGFESLKTARSRDAEYSDYRSRDPGTYLLNEGRILLTLLRLPGGAVDARQSPIDYLSDPQVLVYAGLTALGLAMLARSGNALPVLVVLSALLIFPAFSARHDILPRQGRYLAPLLPLLFTSVASAACVTGATLSRWLAGRAWPDGTRRLLGLAAAALLIVTPLVPLQRYYADSVASGETNERFFRLLARIESSRTHDELIVLDNQLEQEHLGGGGTAIQTMNFMLTTRGIPHQEITIDPDRLDRRFSGSRIILVLAEKTYRNHAATLRLAPAPGQQALVPPDPYGVYLLVPATAER